MYKGKLQYCIKKCSNLHFTWEIPRKRESGTEAARQWGRQGKRERESDGVQREMYPNTETKRCKHLSFKYRWPTLSRCSLWAWGGWGLISGRGGGRSLIRTENEKQKSKFPLLFPQGSHRAGYISTVWDKYKRMFELLKPAVSSFYEEKTRTRKKQQQQQKKNPQKIN